MIGDMAGSTESVFNGLKKTAADAGKTIKAVGSTIKSGFQKAGRKIAGLFKH